MTLPAILDGLRLPVIGSPMFIVSTPELVIAQCTAGIVGSFPALNARPAAQLDDWLAEITETLAAWDRSHPDRPAAPFAVNQIVHRSNARLEADLALAVKYQVPITITSLGAREEVNEATHSYGGIVLHDVINSNGRRRSRRWPVAVRTRGRTSGVVRRADSTVRSDRLRAGDPGSAGDGGRPCLHRFRLHSHR